LLSYIVGVPSYGGRLGWALTKSGLTYAAAATNSFGASSGAILLSTECDTRNTDSVIQAIREVVDGVAERGVTEWELREAQAFMLGRAVLYGARDDSDEEVLAAALNRSEESGVDQLDPPTLSRAYLSVTLAELNRTARRYYRPELLHVVAAGAVPSQPEQIFPAGTFRRLFDQ
jgi:predicted Zn-dependent peptidase